MRTLSKIHFSLRKKVSFAFCYEKSHIERFFAIFDHVPEGNLKKGRNFQLPVFQEESKNDVKIEIGAT